MLAGVAGLGARKAARADPASAALINARHVSAVLINAIRASVQALLRQGPSKRVQGVASVLTSAPRGVAIRKAEATAGIPAGIPPRVRAAPASLPAASSRARVAMPAMAAMSVARPTARPLPTRALPTRAAAARVTATRARGKTARLARAPRTRVAVPPMGDAVAASEPSAPACHAPMRQAVQSEACGDDSGPARRTVSRMPAPNR